MIAVFWYTAGIQYDKKKVYSSLSKKQYTTVYMYYLLWNTYPLIFITVVLENCKESGHCISLTASAEHKKTVTFYL